MEQRRIVIIGGGYTGLSAAYELSKRNFKVTVLEADSQLGGLAGTFELQPGVRVERFYHHWFSNDTDILGLIHEIGASDRIKRVETNTGLFYANSIFRLAKPWDLLTFTPLPFVDRIRTGWMALAARRINDWRRLESLSAAEWIRSYAGKNSLEVIWKPLLKGKFGKEWENISAVWFWNKIKLRGSSRNEKSREELLYVKGGFGGITDHLARTLESRGVEIRKNTRVEKILTSNGAAAGVICNGETISSTHVLATVPLPIFLSMAPELPAEYRRRCEAIRYLGNICLVLRLKRSLSETYWLNVSDPNFPFVGVIEHTNMDARENYGGEYLAYISKYLGTDEALFKLADKEYLVYCIPFIKRIFPAFSEEWLHGFACWRAEYSQPVITKHYSSLIPESRTPVKNLWLSTMAQVYPEDRGTNYAVREGRKIGLAID